MPDINFWINGFSPSPPRNLDVIFWSRTLSPTHGEGCYSASTLLRKLLCWKLELPIPDGYNLPDKQHIDRRFSARWMFRVHEWSATGGIYDGTSGCSNRWSNMRAVLDPFFGATPRNLINLRTCIFRTRYCLEAFCGTDHCQPFSERDQLWVAIWYVR